MRPNYFLLLALCFFSANSQNKINLKGRVLDGSSQVPLEAATVYLMSVADSTMIDYTITDRAGNFSLTTQKIEKPVFLKVSFTGFQILQVEEKSLSESKDYGILRLSDAPVELGEVIIKSEAPPIRIKNDTLEFNASSFKLRPDANVEALLKQLPGVEIDSDGKITVNGKEVNQILVNGKPFFDKDGKIALQNLPSELINKVQVTDSKTKKEELSGTAATSNNASINLTIDEDKNKGFFGKVTGGYGTDERYESSVLMNYFKGKRKISLLGSSNNINTTGFSMDEIFDSMGGGRNMSVYTSDNGAFGINGMRFGGGNGITRTNMLGLNYSDQWIKDFDTNASYFFNSANTENVNRSRQVNLLPEGSFTTESNSASDEERYAHNFSADFEYKIDSTMTLYFNPKFVKSHSGFTNESSEFSVDDNGQLQNENNADNFNEEDKNEFSGNAYFNKNFKRKGRMLGVSVDAKTSKSDNQEMNRSETIFYNDDDNDGIVEPTADIRNQIRRGILKNDSYAISLDYSEPLKDSIKVKIGADFNSDFKKDQRNMFDFNPVSGMYSELNGLLSRNLISEMSSVTPWAGFMIEKKKITANASLGTKVTDFRNRADYLGNSIAVSRDYMLPYANANFRYRFSKSKSAQIYYQYDADFPEPTQILPIPDLSNPLNTISGNPDIEPDQYHYLYVSFRNFDFATKSGYNFYAGGTIYSTKIISSSVFDENLKRTTTYENVSGTSFLWGGANWNMSKKKNAHAFKYGIGANANLIKSKGFTNGDLYEATTLRLTPRVNFSYDYGELLSINPTYNLTLSSTNYSNYVISHAENVIHRLNLQVTSYWPKHVVFGNDFGYTYNSNIADGFKKDFYLWNTSLGYNFLSDKLLAKVKVYDVLNQNQNSTRSITPTTIRDEENTVLKRYLMFSLTYKVGTFEKKK